MAKRGYTLIELMVVIAIICILVAFGYTNYVTSLKKARDGKRKSDLEQIRGALEMYRTDEEEYPGLLDDIWSTYMKEPTDPEGYTFNYSSIGGQTYFLWICLENAKDPDAIDEGSCPSGKKYQVENP